MKPPPRGLPTLAAPSSWWAVRVSPESAEEIRRVWRAPERDLGLALLFREFRALEPSIAARVKHIEWSTAEPLFILNIIEQAASVLAALDRLPPLGRLPRRGRWSLYLAALIVGGREHAQAGKIADPLEYARQAGYFHLAGPDAEHEANRRAGGHIGSLYGELLLRIAITRQTGRTDAGLDRLADRLLALAYEEGAPIVQAREGRTMSHHDVRHTLRAESVLRAEQWREQKAIDPLHAYGLGLGGDLNFMKAAVINALKTGLRNTSRATRRERGVKSAIKKNRAERGTWKRALRSEVGEAQKETVSLWVSPELSQDDEKLLDRLPVYVEEFRQAHPEHAQGLDLLLDRDTPPGQHALRLNVTVKTVFNRKNRALAALKAWIQDREASATE